MNKSDIVANVLAKILVLYRSEKYCLNKNDPRPKQLYWTIEPRPLAVYHNILRKGTKCSIWNAHIQIFQTWALLDFSFVTGSVLKMDHRHSPKAMYFSNAKTTGYRHKSSIWKFCCWKCERHVFWGTAPGNKSISEWQLNDSRHVHMQVKTNTPCFGVTSNWLK